MSVLLDMSWLVMQFPLACSWLHPSQILSLSLPEFSRTLKMGWEWEFQHSSWSWLFQGIGAAGHADVDSWNVSLVGFANFTGSPPPFIFLTLIGFFTLFLSCSVSSSLFLTPLPPLIKLGENAKMTNRPCLPSHRELIPRVTILYMRPKGHRQWPGGARALIDQFSLLLLETCHKALTAFETGRWCGPIVDSSLQVW